MHVHLVLRPVIAQSVLNVVGTKGSLGEPYHMITKSHEQSVYMWSGLGSGKAGASISISFFV